MFNTIKSKIIIAGIIAVAIPVIFILTLVNKEKANISNTVVKEAAKQLNEHMQSVAQDTYSLCESQQELLEKVMQANMNVLMDKIKEKGGIFLLNEGAGIEWNAVNQSNHKESRITLPKLGYGAKGWLDSGTAGAAAGGWFAPNYESSSPTPLIDETAALIGGTCTIFQRINEAGDMLRVATNVIGKDGKRAIGTYIPAIEDSGSKNLIIESMLASKPYTGRAFVVDSWYVANYTPLKDEAGKLIGMAYVGIKQESVESLRKAVMNIKIGKTGYVFVIGGSGSHLGHYVISYKGASDGKNIYDARDPSGRQVIKEMIDLSKNARGKTVEYQYYWQNKDEKEPRLKMASVIYFEKWDWVIGASAYLDEFTETTNIINADIDKLFTNSILAAILSLILALLLTVTIGNGVGKNIAAILSTIKNLTDSIALGKLNIRGDRKAVTEEFAPVIDGVNLVMDTYNKPIEVTVKSISSIAQGVLPEKITEQYHGDFNKIKDSLNDLIDILGDFSTQMKNIYKDHSAGEIDVKLNLDKFKGIYADIGESVSKTINYHVTAILKALSIIEDYGVKGDFSRNLERMPGKQVIMNQMLDALKNNLQSVITETKMLAKAGVEGRLKTRGSADKFVGDYSEIIKGINATLDSVIKPVEEATKILEAMANGDLSVDMKGDYAGDHAILKNSLNSTIDSMNDIISQVLIAADQVESGSTQVSEASQSLSQAATEQASSLEEISSTMQQINSQAKQNEQGASEASRIALETRKSAEEGNVKMANMQKAMGEINEASANVAKIIKAIDEIAFQTNLLALNAAVEAARAGKHGKGFTVVAEEVRNLAQRSAKAAKETAEMIEGSIKKAEAGSKIAVNTSESLAEINGSVTKVTDLIGEIAAASKEQTTGTIQVNQGLSQIDQVTQQNTATAEEAAAASEELSSQARELKSMLTRFKLKNNPAAGTKTFNAYLKNDSEAGGKTKPKMLK